MDYAELAYFAGDHCHHCAARDEWRRLERKRAEVRRVLERRGRRR